jgi:CelD/BcsL family acetyltransferase involved in cellulose biosynthesis
MLSTDGALVPQSYFRDAPAVERTKPAVARDAACDIALALYDDPAALESDWRAFQENADCTVFQTFEWLSCWQRHIGAHDGVQPCIVMGRDGRGQILFILPLAVGRKGFGRELTWLGTALCDYNAPLLAPACPSEVIADFKTLWTRILRAVQADGRFHFDLVRLEKMPAMIGGKPNPMLGLPTALHPSGAYETPLLPANWDEFYSAKRSSATRRRERKKRSRLAEFGDITFTTPDNRDGILDAMTVLVAQKSAWFAQRGIPNMFARPDTVAFYRDFVSNPQNRHLAHVGQLAVGTDIAAANFGLTFRGRYHYVLSSYIGGEMSHLGPGVVHLHELIRYAIEHKFTVFDFTVGDEHYKLEWCERTQSLHDHLAVTTVRGAAMAAPMRAAKWLKRQIKQTPLLWAIFSKARKLAAVLQPRRAES